MVFYLFFIHFKQLMSYLLETSKTQTVDISVLADRNNIKLKMVNRDILNKKNENT